MPAKARLQFSQACYAGRLAGSESASIRGITEGSGELAQRLRLALSGTEGQGRGGVNTIVERTLLPRGLRFPGLIEVPPAISGKEEREQHSDRARRFASEFEGVENTFWTDGSAYPGGVAAGAVVTCLVDQDMSSDDPLTALRVEIERRGTVSSRPRSIVRGRARGRERMYGESRRSFVRHRCSGGLVAEAWTLRGGASAFDAELSALARAVELGVHQTTPSTHFRILTDSQAAMRQLADDRPGPGQREAVRGILGAERILQRGADISVHWIPGHAGIAGNEIADQWAGDAAARG